MRRFSVLYMVSNENKTNITEVDVNMAKTTYKVGDKVRITNAQGSKHRNGDEGIIVSITPIWDVVFYDVDVNGMQQGHYDKDIELAPQKPTKNQRITTLEQTVADLQAEVEALKATQKLPVTVIADAIQRYNERTPNEQRKAIIDEATAFLIEVEREQNDSKVRGKGNAIHRQYLTKTEFIFNADKRTVVAIIRSKYGTTVLSKGIAKCAPDDVFNADIGKAIALGRALGLDVSKFEKAVQPDYYAVGHVITFPKDDEWHGKLNYRVDKIADGGSTLTKLFEEGGKANANTACTQYYETDIKSALPIIDDTEAQY